MNYWEVKMGKPGCPIHRTAEVIGGKWTLLILRDLFDGTKRFGELRASLTGISPKTLSERLRLLEQADIIARTIYPEVPPRVEYALTPRGQMLQPIIETMREWGTHWAAVEDNG
jgi:DNA-binding HxlR family transcriptional regulator